MPSWAWLTDYLQIQVDLRGIVAGFPDDPALQEAVRKHLGLRLLRQDPWECLASFLLSSNKRITQIQAVHRAVRERFGSVVPTPAGHPAVHGFPTPEALAGQTEARLRSCGMGFRARYLLEAAVRVAQGKLDLGALRQLPLDEARRQLEESPGVGPKIADCVLLFSGDQARAFPVDVWVTRTLRRHYFGNRPVSLPRLRAFAAEHFGRFAGYAQQYLFHAARFTSQPSSEKPARAEAKANR
jgi:N-glycosylase/DNA lyase